MLSLPKKQSKNKCFKVHKRHVHGMKNVKECLHRKQVQFVQAIRYAAFNRGRRSIDGEIY